MRAQGVDGRLSRRAFVNGLVELGASATGLALAGGCGLVAGRQQTTAARVGVLMADTPPAAYWSVFPETLHARGWVEGRTLTLEYRNAEGRYEQLPTLATELVRLPVDVLVATGATAAFRAAKAATSSIPIVFAGAGDPVGEGLVDSLARPGGNLTGPSLLLGPVVGLKKIELLKQALPELSCVGFLINGNNPSFVRSAAASRDAAEALGMQLVELDFGAPEQLESVFATARRSGVEALSVGLDGFLLAQMPAIIGLTARERLPAMYSGKLWCEAGGLMGYGQSTRELYQTTAGYVDRILRGAKPADLPVEQPTVFDFVVNVTTAKALGVTIPPEVAAQVTEWVQ